MKRVIIFTAALLVASWATAQTSNQAGAQGQGQNPPPQGTQAQPGAQGQAGAAGAQAQPGPVPKRPPQAKTQEEFKAFQTAAASDRGQVGSSRIASLLSAMTALDSPFLANAKPRFMKTSAFLGFRRKASV